MVTTEFTPPYSPCRRVHLSAVRAANHRGEEFCHLHGFLAGKPVDFNLEILRPKFANKDGTAEKVARQHPIA